MNIRDIFDQKKLVFSFEVFPPKNTSPIKNIYKAKERSFKSPLIVLVSDVKKIEEVAYVEEKNREAIEKLIAKFWTGGLTIILKKKEWIPNIMTADGDTVGVRMPALNIAQKIIKAAGGLLPTTSANISGEKTPRAYDELSDTFKERVDIIVDGGKSTLGTESTIIDMTDKPKILRLGAISIEDIEKVIGKI